MAVALGIMTAVFVVLAQVLKLIIQIPHDNVLAVANAGENY
ncbi:hypothetical protein ambt_20980 [Alteromonas naphthalenivorans]|uniref:Uncharacterized protein n=1 Tax=Alteromonas naphthalenivorans TaxID=715451 RepID=F5Z724_ALTNA|nr:hypothetical protein ambt_20980 [Alteromonas naphthalenivorans]